MEATCDWKELKGDRKLDIASRSGFAVTGNEPSSVSLPLNCRWTNPKQRPRVPNVRRVLRVIGIVSRKTGQIISFAKDPVHCPFASQIAHLSRTTTGECSLAPGSSSVPFAFLNLQPKVQPRRLVDLVRDRRRSAMFQAQNARLFSRGRYAPEGTQACIRSLPGDPPASFCRRRRIGRAE